MAEIRRFWFLRHLRAEPTSHVFMWKGGVRKHTGPGLAFWFSPLGASIAEVPLADRDLPFVFRTRSADFQEVAVNGSIGWRVIDPALLAQRVDFSLDALTGKWKEDPLDKLAAMLTGMAQELASTFLAQSPLRLILERGNDGVRSAIQGGLSESPALAGLGLEIGAVTIARVAPATDVEKALQTPAREKIQQSADEATFERRALAVEKERAIQENELESQIELARREEQLIAQRGQNERRRATEAAEAQRIAAESDGAKVRLEAAAQSDSVRLVESARVGAERERTEIYRDLPAVAMYGLAARELAGSLTHIDHLSVGSDGLGALLQRALGAAATRLET